MWDLRLSTNEYTCIFFLKKKGGEEKNTLCGYRLIGQEFQIGIELVHLLYLGIVFHGPGILLAYLCTDSIDDGNNDDYPGCMNRYRITITILMTIIMIIIMMVLYDYFDYYYYYHHYCSPASSVLVLDVSNGFPHYCALDFFGNTRHFVRRAWGVTDRTIVDRIAIDLIDCLLVP